jgi:hypothetical protein
MNVDTTLASPLTGRHSSIFLSHDLTIPTQTRHDTPTLGRRTRARWIGTHSVNPYSLMFPTTQSDYLTDTSAGPWPVFAFDISEEEATRATNFTSE